MNEAQLEKPTEAASPPPEAVSKEKVSSYVVQMLVLEPSDEPVWRDVATVDVPLRSHRRTAVLGAITQLMQEQELTDDDFPLEFRALDAETAQPIPARLEQIPPPPPELKVG